MVGWGHSPRSSELGLGHSSRLRRAIVRGWRGGRADRALALSDRGVSGGPGRSGPLEAGFRSSDWDSLEFPAAEVREEDHDDDLQNAFRGFRAPT